MKPWLKRSWPILLLALIVIAYFWQPITKQELYYVNDTRDIYLPLEEFYAQKIKSGEVPLWSQWVQAGYPVHASDQIGVFYPVTFLTRLLFSPILSYNIALAVNLFIAGLGTYFFLRVLGLRRSASFIGGVTFMMNGFFIHHLVHMNMLQSAVWFPWILFFTEKFFRSGKGMYTLGATLALAFSFLAGQPQIPVYTVPVFIIYYLFRAWFFRKENVERNWKGIVFGLALIGVLAMGIAFVQLYPTWELKGLSERSTGLDTEVALGFSFHPVDTPLFIFPYFFGTNDEFWGPGRTYDGIYTGIVILFLALVSLFVWRRSIYKRYIVFFFALMIFAGLFMLGKYSPLRFIGFDPVITLFRGASRSLYFVEFGLAVLGAIGLHSLITKREALIANLGKALTWVISIVTVIIFIGVAASNIFLFPGQDALAQRMQERVDKTITSSTEHVFDSAYYYEKINDIVSLAQQYTVSLTNWRTWISLLLFTAVFTIWILFRKGKLTGTKLIQALIVLIVFDLFVFSFNFHDTFSKSYIDSTPATAEFLHDREGDNLYRVFPIPREEGVIGALFTEQVLPWKEETIWRTNMHEAMTNQRYEIANSLWPASLGIFRHGQAMEQIRAPGGLKNTNFLDLYNIKYVLSDHELNNEQNPLSYRNVYSDGTTWIYENSNVLPRIYVVGDYKVIANDADARSFITSDAFSPADMVILSNEPSLTSVSDLQYQLSNIIYSDQEVSLEIQSSSPGLLVLSDTWYPGWRALVNGQETEILRANTSLRAVPIPEGDSFVQFTFNSETFAWGWKISAVAIVLTLLFFGITLDDIIKTWKRKQ